VVVDDVENHFDPRAVQRLDHPFELADGVRRGGVPGVRCEVPDRGVPPVVRQAAVVQESLVGDVVDREQLDRGDAELLQVREGGVGGERGIRAAQVVTDLRVQLREALDVGLVDDSFVPRDIRPPVVLPVEARVYDDALRDRVGVVLVVELEIRVLSGARDVREDVRPVPLHRPLDRLRIRVDEELVRVEAVPRLRLVGAVHAIAVPPAWADARQVAVPDMRGDVLDLDARLVLGVEEGELDALGVLGEEREVRPLAVPRRTERERPSRPDFHQPGILRYSGASQTAPSGGSVNVEENGCSCHGSASASTPPRLPTPLPP
jgi:hypothetical protein